MSVAVSGTVIVRVELAVFAASVIVSGESAHVGSGEGPATAQESPTVSEGLSFWDATVMRSLAWPPPWIVRFADATESEKLGTGLAVLPTFSKTLTLLSSELATTSSGSVSPLKSAIASQVGRLKI